MEMEDDFKQKPQVLTKTERAVFDAVADSISIKEAAAKLKVSVQDLYNFFYNLRKKYYRRRQWVNTVIAQKKRGKVLRRALTDREHASLEQVIEDKEDREKEFMEFTKRQERDQQEEA
jgi:DNA-binding CsgD family transcriptional regulator